MFWDSQIDFWLPLWNLLIFPHLWISQGDVANSVIVPLWVASHLLTFQMQDPSISVPQTQVPSASSFIHFTSHSKTCLATSHFFFFFTFASFLFFSFTPINCFKVFSQHKTRLNFMALLQPFWKLTALAGFPYDSMCSAKKAPSAVIFLRNNVCDSDCLDGLTTIISTRCVAHNCMF